MRTTLNALLVTLIILLFWYLIFALIQFNINPTEWDRLALNFFLLASIPTALYGFLKVCAEY